MAGSWNTTLEDWSCSILGDTVVEVFALLRVRYSRRTAAGSLVD